LVQRSSRRRSTQKITDKEETCLIHDPYENARASGLIPSNILHAVFCAVQQVVL
jgi:hypothetical protein